MSDTVTFYFDFSSPYGYLAAHRIDGIVSKYGREVIWRPILLGAVFKVSGGRPITDFPMRWEYAKRDFNRSARLVSLPFALPETFPFASTAVARAFYWIDERQAALAKQFAKTVFKAAFAEGRDINRPETIISCVEQVGLIPRELLAGIESEKIKERLRKEVDDAIQRGVFGSPFVLIGDEPFWGHDRLVEVDAWLASGGW